MNDVQSHREPQAAPPGHHTASLPVRLLVMGLLFVLSVLAIWSIDGRILHTMRQHDPAGEAETE